jgi:hypothetical protein
MLYSKNMQIRWCGHQKRNFTKSKQAPSTLTKREKLKRTMDGKDSDTRLEQSVLETLGDSDSIHSASTNAIHTYSRFGGEGMSPVIRPKKPTCFYTKHTWRPGSYRGDRSREQ